MPFDLVFQGLFDDDGRAQSDKRLVAIVLNELRSQYSFMKTVPVDTISSEIVVEERRQQDCKGCAKSSSNKMRPNLGIESSRYRMHRAEWLALFRKHAN
jgi:hypothetical protein